MLAVLLSSFKPAIVCTTYPQEREVRKQFGYVIQRDIKMRYAILRSTVAFYDSVYARDIGRKISSGYRQKQKEGIVIIAPFGYWKNKNTRRVEIVDEAAETVRLIFSLYLDGVGLKPITQLLNTQRRKTPAQMQAELYGKHKSDIRTGEDGLHLYFWTYTSVKRILSDESYAGTLCNHKREMRNGKIVPF